MWGIKSYSNRLLHTKTLFCMIFRLNFLPYCIYTQIILCIILPAWYCLSQGECESVCWSSTNVDYRQPQSLRGAIKHWARRAAARHSASFHPYKPAIHFSALSLTHSLLSSISLGLHLPHLFKERYPL